MAAGRITPDLFLGPMDHMMERNAHRGMADVTLGNEVFTDLDFVDDVTLLAEMLEVLVLAMIIMEEEAAVFGLQINWSKTKILLVPSSMRCSTVQVADGHVDMVNGLVCLGSMINSGGSRGEVLHRIGIAQSCMSLLEKRIWKSSIRLNTKIRLYQTYIVPVLLYGCKTWSITKLHCSCIDAFDMWAWRKILRIPYTCHVTNVEVRTTTRAIPFPSWSLTDVCGSSDILPAAHHKRTTNMLSLR